MTKHLSCPACGCTSFEQDRTTTYDESVIVSFSPNGEIEDERIEDQEHNGEESSGAYRCEECGWQLVDENGDPIDDPTEIVGKFEQASKTKHASSYVRETFQEWLESDEDTVGVDDNEVGLDWFVEKLTGCPDILPAGYCSDLDLPQGSTYGNAVAYLSKRGGK